MDDYNINETNQTSSCTAMISWKHLFISQLILDRLYKNTTRSKLWGQPPRPPKYIILMLVVLNSINELQEHLTAMQ